MPVSTVRYILLYKTILLCAICRCNVAGSIMIIITGVCLYETYRAPQFRQEQMLRGYSLWCIIERNKLCNVTV